MLFLNICYCVVPIYFTLYNIDNPYKFCKYVVGIFLLLLFIPLLLFLVKKGGGLEEQTTIYELQSRNTY